MESLVFGSQYCILLVTTPLLLLVSTVSQCGQQCSNYSIIWRLVHQSFRQADLSLGRHVRAHE